MVPRVEILENDVRMDEYNHFSVFMRTGEKDSKTFRVDAYFGYVWTGPYCF